MEKELTSADFMCIDRVLKCAHADSKQRSGNLGSPHVEDRTPNSSIAPIHVYKIHTATASLCELHNRSGSAIDLDTSSNLPLPTARFDHALILTNHDGILRLVNRQKARMPKRMDVDPMEHTSILGFMLDCLPWL